jgi:N6-adenosine-specific RNA methylase IME4
VAAPTDSRARAGVILIDPAQEFWTYSGEGKQRSAERHYDTTTLDEIKTLPVVALAAKGRAVFCWVTNAYLLDVARSLRSLGSSNIPPSASLGSN